MFFDLCARSTEHAFGPYIPSWPLVVGYQLVTQNIGLKLYEIETILDNIANADETYELTLLHHWKMANAALG